MKSEKEIKQKDFSDFIEFTGVTLGGIKQYRSNSNKTKRWLFEGEPRYSISEIEKVIQVNQIGIDSYLDLMYYLKDKKLVEAILNDS